MSHNSNIINIIDTVLAADPQQDDQKPTHVADPIAQQTEPRPNPSNKSSLKRKATVGNLHDTSEASSTSSAEHDADWLASGKYQRTISGFAEARPSRNSTVPAHTSPDPIYIKKEPGLSEEQLSPVGGSANLPVESTESGANDAVAQAATRDLDSTPAQIPTSPVAATSEVQDAPAATAPQVQNPAASARQVYAPQLTSPGDFDAMEKAFIHELIGKYGAYLGNMELNSKLGAAGRAAHVTSKEIAAIKVALKELYERNDAINHHAALKVDVNNNRVMILDTAEQTQAVAKDFKKFQSRATQKELREQILSLKEEVAVLRSPTVTLEGYATQLGSFRLELSAQDGKMDNFKRACQTELDRLAKARKAFASEASDYKRNRKDDVAVVSEGLEEQARLLEEYRAKAQVERACFKNEVNELKEEGEARREHLNLMDSEVFPRLDKLEKEVKEVVASIGDEMKELLELKNEMKKSLAKLF